ncbi:MAG: TolC family protein [Bacteroidetes bacterium]|nr:MAG: TolC family protein [Bacteroidota bacterium]
MRKFALTGLFILLLFQAAKLHAQGSDKWDLKRCIEYAMTNNISVRQADVQARFSELTLKQSKLQQIPSLNFSGNHGLTFGRSLNANTNIYSDQSALTESMSLTSQATIFNWNSQRNTIKGNDLSYQADKAAVDKAKNDIGLNVARQYLLILLDIESERVNEIQLNQSKAQLDNTRKQVNAGALPELNAAELEAQVARDSATWVSSQTTAEVDKLVLKAMLNLGADVPFELETPPVEQIPVDNILELTPAGVYALAMKTQPQIKANNLRLMASQKYYEAQRGRLYPTISAYGQLNTRYFSPFTPQYLIDQGIQPTNAYVLDGGGNKSYVYAQQTSIGSYKSDYFSLYDGYWKQHKDNFGQAVGINVSVPIFNGWSQKANVEKAKLDIQNKQLSVEQDTLKLKEDVYTAYNQAMGSFLTFQARQKSVQTAERSFDLATKRYNIGSMQTIEWLTNQANLYNARINYLISQFDYVFKMKVLEYYKGQGLRLN